MKLRNSLAILCSAAFCFSFALAGCNTRNNGGQTGKDTWTVTFNSMGGSEVAPVEVKNGETVAKPADPTKENYTFKQWCEDEAGVTPFDFNTPITTNWTLFATWTPSGSGGGGGGGGGDITPPDPTTYPYYVTIGSDTKGLTEVDKDASDPSNLVSKYKATLESVTAGAQITFTDGNETIRPGSDTEDATNKNNKNGSWDDGFTIHNDATNVEVWLKKWSDGYSFWITGYSNGTPGVDYVTIYFRDASWWNNSAASTNFLAWSGTQPEGRGQMMTHLQWVPDSGFNYWSCDIPVSSTHIMFFRTGGNNGADDWGARTVAIALTDRGANNMYDISSTSAAWYGNGQSVTGVWATYSA